MKALMASLLLGFAALGLSAQAAAPAVPGPAPDWQLPRLDGGSLGLAELRGQVVLIDFWASWCVPCRLSLPALRALQQDYAGQGLRVVTISVDEDRAAAQRFQQRYGADLVALHDADGRVAAAYGLIGMPSSFIIDPQGQLVLRHEGFRKGEEDVWRKEIRRLLPVRQ